MIFIHELTDMPPNCVTRVSHCRAVIQAGRLHIRRTINGPRLPPDRAGKYRARSLLLPVAERDDIMKTLPKIWVNHLRFDARNVDTELSHRGYGIRVQATSFSARTYDFEFVARELPKKRLRHLRAARVLSAKKQNSRFDRHVMSLLFANLGDLGRLDRLVASATFGVEKPKQFLQRFSIGGIAKKSALTTHRDEFFVPELIQVMR